MTLAVGLLIGQWLAFSGLPSPAGLYRQGLAAWNGHDYAGALAHWSRGSTQNPDDPLFHYRRATALARLGYAHAAADAYRLALLLEPAAPIARMAREGLDTLDVPRSASRPTEVPLEPVRGVWVVPVVLDGTRPARFLLDTGSSVTLVSPSLAATLGLRVDVRREWVDLQTVGGRSRGSGAVISSLRLGDIEVNEVPVVVHDPGPGVDGILGNTVLARYRLTVDAGRRLLRLGSAETD